MKTSEFRKLVPHSPVLGCLDARADHLQVQSIVQIKPVNWDSGKGFQSQGFKSHLITGWSSPLLSLEFRTPTLKMKDLN